MILPSLRLRHAAAAFLLAASAGTHAADASASPKTVNLVTPVGYADDATAKPAVREHCELGQAVQADVIEALRRDGRAVNEVGSTDGAEALGVTINRVQGMGPFTGPKTLSWLVHTYRDGKVTHVKMLTDRSVGFPLQGTCGILQGISKTLAKQLAAWLDDVDAAPAPQPVAAAASQPAM